MVNTVLCGYLQAVVAHGCCSPPAPPAGCLQSLLKQQSQTSLQTSFETSFIHLLLLNVQQD